jgi:phage-related protein
MPVQDKPLLEGEVKTPPFSPAARREAGFLLRMLQQGQNLGMPQCRPMPQIGPRCRELRVNDEDGTWRIVCRVDRDAIVIAEVFRKKTRETPQSVITTCRERLTRYDAV